MAPPSEAQIKVATGALRAEAGVWDQQAATAGRIATQAADLALGRLEAGLFQIVLDAYRSVIDQVAAQSREGQQRMADIAQTLRQVAQTYDAEEAENLHRLKNLY
jgi:uncharacterized protein YukE